MKSTPDIYRVKHLLNAVYVLTAARLLFDASAAAAERRSISRNEAAKAAARNRAYPEAERVFRAGLPRSNRIEGPPPHRDWSHGSHRLHAHRPPMKSKQNTIEVSANPRCGGTKYGRLSFSSGTTYRRDAA